MRIFFEFIYNFGIIISICIISGFITYKFEKHRINTIFQGIIFGTASIIGMLNPVVVSHGLIFDGRSVVISLSSLLFGPYSGAISAIMGIIVRFLQGGPGAKTGIFVILWAMLFGSTLYIIRKRHPFKLNFLFLYLFGIIVHIGMLLLMFSLPDNRALPTLNVISLPVIIIYPIVTLFIGELILFINDQLQINRKLKNKETQIANISNGFQSGIIFQYTILDNFKRKVTYISDGVERIYGVTPNAAMSNPDFIYKTIVDEDAKRFVEQEKIALKNLSQFKTYVRIKKNNDEVKWISITATPKILDDGLIYWDGIAFDITEIKMAEYKIKENLIEKEALLRELYHRTKNNMNVITSFLQLQADRISDNKIVDIFHDAISRIQAMSLVHQKLYSSRNLSRIDLKDYIEDLVKQISIYYSNIYEKIKINYCIEKIDLVIDIAIPLGMIVNEIITNAFKYAFKDRESGIINIEIKRDVNNAIAINISDNGVGLPDNFDIKTCQTLGINIIENITKEQLNGKISFENNNGLTYKIIIKDNLYKERIKE